MQPVVIYACDVVFRIMIGACLCGFESHLSSIFPTSHTHTHTHTHTHMYVDSWPVCVQVQASGGQSNMGSLSHGERPFPHLLPCPGHGCQLQVMSSNLHTCARALVHGFRHCSHLAGNWCWGHLAPHTRSWNQSHLAPWCHPAPRTRSCAVFSLPSQASSVWTTLMTCSPSPSTMPVGHLSHSERQGISL